MVILNNLETLGVEMYCKDIWKVARDPKTMHSVKLKTKEKQVYLGEEVQKGDIIKIGRIKFKLRNFILDLNNTPFEIANGAERNNPNPTNVNLPRNSMLINKNYKREIFVEKNEEIPPCRFCLSNEMDDESNPLINPCE